MSDKIKQSDPSQRAKHHDTGYKELFSYPELVQQLIEGFFPTEIAELMDFATLQIHSGHYITPLFEEKIKPSEPLPPVFPIVLYNGNTRWFKRYLQRINAH